MTQTPITTETLAAIAAELPGDWTGTATHEWSGSLTRADGLTLHAWRPAGDDRATIVLDAPRERIRYNELPPRIGANLARPAATLARDIARRLLPDAETMHAIILERQAEHDAYENAKNETLAACREAMGRAASEPVTHDPDKVHLSRLVDGYGDVTAHRDTVSIELRSIPRAVALDMLRVLAAAAKGGDQ